MKKEHKILVSLFILAFIIRICFVFVMPIPLWDETIYANLGYELSNKPFDYSFENGWSDFVPLGDPTKAGFRAPFLPSVLSLFYFFKIGFFVPFLMPLIGSLSVLFVYSLGKKLFNKRVGFYSSAFLAFIPLHVFYSGRILTGVFCTFFILLTIISFWKGFEEDSDNHKVLFGFFLALALLTRYTTLWVIPLFLIYFLIRDKSLKFLKDKHLWYSILVFFITLIPWFIYGLFEYGNPIGAFIHGGKAASYWGGIQPFYFFFQNWFAMFSVIGAIFIFSLFHLFYKRNFLKKEIYLPLIWTLFFLGIAMLMPHKEDRFLLPLVPSICLLSGFFVSKLRQRKTIFLISIFILLLSCGLIFYSNFNLYHNINTKCSTEVISYLQGIEGDFLMISENPPVFYYFVKQESAYYPALIIPESFREIEGYTSKKIYFIFTRFNSGFETEKHQKLRQIMEENYNLQFECSLDPNVNFVYSN